ncbi:tRNA 2-selenouridine(34) synthase MnmH [Desulforhopalus singaporensis]|uniref:tRNA 2-selenouridine synthase n=1 Tax=Desulforhopalus singaporensis TaxID=91360 RepID=A0A1H0S6K6_9BACT|nr:tRNA 2-selenouridine(34) synthase MnmH [Desulforhopalus singaporensis]SDP37297.1 tRNA 2-selenouridine synthase [Desulforhopalus singaporensis]
MSQIEMDNTISRKTILDKETSTVTWNEAAGQCVVVDVRSMAEYRQGTMVGAVNIALFDEVERSEVGTIYHHGGQERAIEKGFALVRNKLDFLLKDFEVYRERKIAVFCARGGMRSRSVVNLLRQSGYDAVQIVGGYKRYRSDTLALVGNFSPKLIVIHGLTGTGKTRILHRLPEKQSIDLEELARHRSSLFGGLDRRPANQRTFESMLAETIGQLGDEPYFIEGESRKIGQVFIPRQLALAMKKAVLVNVSCSLEKRIARIISDYPVKDDEVLGKMVGILKSLKQKMGAAKVARMCDLLKDRNLEELVRILLVDYYDKRYARSMRNYRFDLEISSESIGDAATELIKFRQSLQSR